MMQHSKTRRLTMITLMATISFLFMYFSFSVPILSPFAEFDLSPIPEIIGGFILGPLGAIEIIGLKLLLKLVFQGSQSMLVGEIQNFFLSVAYVIPAVLYYYKHRTKKGAVIGLVLGSVISVVVAVFTNVYMIFPAYMKLYGMNWEGIVEICSAVNPWIRDVPTMVAFSVIPFNVVSRAVVSIITVVIYKKVSVPIKKLVY